MRVAGQDEPWESFAFRVFMTLPHPCNMQHKVGQGTTTGSGKSESFELSRCRLQNEILRLINFEIFGNPIEL